MTLCNTCCSFLHIQLSQLPLHDEKQAKEDSVHNLDTLQESHDAFSDGSGVKEKLLV